MDIDWKARAEAAEAEAKDACTAADEAEHRASLAYDSERELARCVLQAAQPKGAWVDHPPMSDWTGVIDSVATLRARAEAAEARAAQAEADARLMAGLAFASFVARTSFSAEPVEASLLDALEVAGDHTAAVSDADLIAAVCRILTAARAA